MLKFKISYVRNRYFITIFALFFFWSIVSTAKEPLVNLTPPPINAESALAIDAWDGFVLFEKNPERKLLPASTVKVMTAIIAVERWDLDTKMAVSKSVYHVEPTRAGLKPGEAYKMGDLLAAILIKSGNDAAITIAENIAGSEKKFVELMNQKAKEIGMEDTLFANASGLPYKNEAQYTTAKDLVKLMLYAKQYPVVLELCSKKRMDIYSEKGRKLYLKTHNRLLLKKDDTPWGKTGYTRKAKRTFVGVNPSKTDTRIIFAFLKSDDIWQDMDKLNIFSIASVDRRHSGSFFQLKKKIIEFFSRKPLYLKT